MKIAGRKNDGAWFRANKAIHSMSATERAALNAAVYAHTVETRDAAYNAILALGATSGVSVGDIDGAPTTAATWISRMIENGIPRQIWMGRLSFTTYSIVTEDDEDHYVANHQSEVHYFAQQLRGAVTRFLFGRRAMRDLLNVGSSLEGNPGGLPDSVPE